MHLFHCNGNIGKHLTFKWLLVFLLILAETQTRINVRFHANTPLCLTVAVVAEGTLKDAVECHEAYMCKQLKGLIAVCIRFPFVLTSERERERAAVTSLQGMESPLHSLTWLTLAINVFLQTSRAYVYQSGHHNCCVHTNIVLADCPISFT